MKLMVIFVMVYAPISFANLPLLMRKLSQFTCRQAMVSIYRLILRLLLLWLVQALVLPLSVPFYRNVYHKRQPGLTGYFLESVISLLISIMRIIGKSWQLLAICVC